MFIKAKTEKKNIWDTKEPGLEKKPPMSRINQSIKYTEQRKDYEIWSARGKTYKGKPINTGLFYGNSGSQKGLDR